MRVEPALIGLVPLENGPQPLPPHKSTTSQKFVTRKRVLTWPCWHLDLRLLAFRTARKISVVYEPSTLWYFVIAAKQTKPSPLTSWPWGDVLLILRVSPRCRKAPSGRFQALCLGLSCLFFVLMTQWGHCWYYNAVRPEGKSRSGIMCSTV